PFFAEGEKESLMQDLPPLIPQRLERGHTLFRYRIILIHHAGFDDVKETADLLVRLGDSPMKFGKVFAAATCMILSVLATQCGVIRATCRVSDYEYVGR